MQRTLNDMIAKLPADRQAKIEAEYKELPAKAQQLFAEGEQLKKDMQSDMRVAAVFVVVVICLIAFLVFGH
jgi:molecular chaperone GrpE (heat shock protein)